MRPLVIALLTDFGEADWYVGVLKGVILGVNPEARVIDVTHAIPRHDARAASFALVASRKFFPPGTIFVVVADPGVGGPRKILCATSGGRTYLAPDNGALAEVLDADGYEDLVSVENPCFMLQPVSPTFHARDVFAPVAAHLSLGLPVGQLGPKLDSFVRGEARPPEVRGNSAVVAIRWVDSFGNLITNCPAELAGELAARWGGIAANAGPARAIGFAKTYEDVSPGAPLCLVGSSGFLEISIRGGSAARELGLGLGGAVTLEAPCR
ncbi:MAG TPA: SAM-dependent chlorinase/fluorinase [bacterium]|nr:SAM-dependent chlorinase/fluorinase [bacterium]